MRRNEPIAEILFAAKSGFLTKDLWLEFFAEGSIGWKNKMWASFSKEKLFFPHYHKLAKDVLVPNKNHPLVKNIAGELISSAPYVSQMDHDERMARIVLTLIRNGIATNYRLEPELRKMNATGQAHYDSQQKEKLPDALVLLSDQKKTKVAIELELTKKDPKRYRKIMNTYSSFQKADKVIFVVRDDRISQSIKQAMRDVYYPHWDKPVGFGRLDDWIQNPTMAAISFSEDVTDLFEMTKNKTENIAKD